MKKARSCERELVERNAEKKGVNVVEQKNVVSAKKRKELTHCFPHRHRLVHRRCQQQQILSLRPSRPEEEEPCASKQNKKKQKEKQRGAKGKKKKFRPFFRSLCRFFFLFSEFFFCFVSFSVLFFKKCCIGRVFSYSRASRSSATARALLSAEEQKERKEKKKKNVKKNNNKTPVF